MDRWKYDRWTRGGMKLNLLKKNWKHLNDEIILFTDSYDVIFKSDEK